MDTEITDIEEKIASIKQELVDLRKSYIKEHAIYQLGEDVVIRDVKGKIVDILMVDVWDNLEPSFSYFWSRYKQDGTLSDLKQQLYVDGSKVFII